MSSETKYDIKHGPEVNGDQPVNESIMGNNTYATVDDTYMYDDKRISSLDFVELDVSPEAPSGNV